jgi:putative GTP pyrophosphokinase
MEQKDIDAWIESTIPKHKILTNTVVNIVTNLLERNGIDYLAISGRTKDAESVREKINRKNYQDPAAQMTDLSGIRIIAFFESDVDRISGLIEESFEVDRENSMSKDLLLGTDQIGYRSVHYVCDLGESRASLPEFTGLSGLKFEFQIRTVLQHAWAELAHDRNYKFSGKLPREIERKLYLYAGMLEIADKGFDELSHQIDDYIQSVSERTSRGDFDIEITSISLEEYVEKWAQDTGFHLVEFSQKADFSDLVRELSEMGVRELSELIHIIPDNYSEVTARLGYSTNIYGLLRDWMIIHDYKRYHDEVSHDWMGYDSKSLAVVSEILGADEMAELEKIYSDHDLYLDL